MVRRGRRRRKKRSSATTLAKGLLVLFVLAGAAAGAASWLVTERYGPSGETLIDIAAGSSAARIGRQLEEAGIIRSRWGFELVRLWRRGNLRAGEYRFDHPAAVTEVYARIQRGDVYTKAVTIPEGANVFEVATRLEQAGLGRRVEFLRTAARDVGLVSDLDPRAASLEGYLFPDTYRFSPRATPEQIASAMVKRFRVAAAQIGLSKDVHDVVTMASLVERETAVDEERPLVAGVFTNRIKKKMALMTDPSIVYGLELDGRWRGAIYKSDLNRDTPWNTYKHAGLPPGPIANPGLKSLRAAMEPAQTDYIYFVAAGANPQGKSLFARTLEEQSRNVAGYRKAVKKAGAR
jgi:UPF0755 protein